MGETEIKQLEQLTIKFWWSYGGLEQENDTEKAEELLRQNAKERQLGDVH